MICYAVRVRNVDRAGVTEINSRVGRPAKALSMRPAAGSALHRHVAGLTAFKLNIESPRAESRRLFVLGIDRLDVAHGRVYHRHVHTINLETRRLCPGVR